MEEMLERIKNAWDNEKIILVYDDDDREAEIDFIIPSSICTPEHIAMMRRHAGGLICCALPGEFAEGIELPYLDTLYHSAGSEFDSIKLMSQHSLPYGAKSAFSVSINHVDCFTGITDWERSLTVQSVADIVSKYDKNEDTKTAKQDFGNTFRIPGHVPLLIARKGLLKERQGHTELGIAISEMIGYPKSTVVCEMLSKDTDKAANLKEAVVFAEKYNLPLIEGNSIINIWKNQQN